MNLDDKNIFNELNNRNLNNSNSNNTNKQPQNNLIKNISGMGDSKVMDFELTYVDYLTSQYIDAELSFSEDAELRELIAKDEKSKLAFDSSVDIFLAIKKENAALELNNDLFSKKFFDDTEDLLMDKLFGNDVILNETKDKFESLKEHNKEHNKEHKSLVFENSSLYAKDLHAKDIEPAFAELEQIELKANAIKNSNTEKSTKILQLNRVKNYYSQINIRKFAAVAACLMIFSIYNISEFKNELGITSFASINMEMKYNDETINDYKQNDNKQNNEQLNKVKPNTNGLDSYTQLSNETKDNETKDKSIENGNTINSDLYLVSANQPTKESSILNANIENVEIAANDKKEANNQIIESNKFKNKIENKFDNIADNSSNQEPKTQNENIALNTLDNNNSKLQYNYNEPNYFSMDKPKLNTKINSSVSNEFSNSFFVDKHNAQVSHYAQSVAFEISENTDFGFELGYSDMNFDDKANLKITKEIPNPTPGSNLKTYTTIIVPVELRKNYSLYWAMGFMESKVVNIAGIDLLGRVGLGLSNDGALTYIRLNSRYELLNNLFVNLGVDSRYMSVNLPLYVNAQNIRHTSSFSINYGIQYKF